MSSPDSQQPTYSRQSPYNRQPHYDRQQYYPRGSSDHRYNNKPAKPNKLLTVILGILATFFLCFLIVLAVLHSMSIAPIVQDVIQEIPIAGLIEDFDYNNEFYVWYQVNGLSFNERRISYYDIEMFVKNETVSEEIGLVLDGYFRALAAGNLDHHITTDDVIGIAKNIRPELNEFFDHQMTDEDIERLAITMDDILDFNAMSIGGLLEDFDIELPVPRFLISTGLVFVVAVICLILLAIIVLLRRYNLPDGFTAAGIPVVLSGLIMFVSGLWLDAFSGSLSRSVHPLAVHLGDPAGYMMQYGFVFAGSGVLIIVISIMIGKLKTPRNI